MARRSTFGLLLLAFVVTSGVAAQDQQTDSTRVRADTLVSPFEWRTARDEAGLPIRSDALDTEDWLGREMGVFHYDFGEAGWPDGLSFVGTDPDQLGLSLDGIPYSDLFSDRPRTDLLPLGSIGRPEVTTGFGRTATAVAQLRPLASSVPLTELKYQTGTGGLQYISALHAQRRRAPGILGGRSARLGVMANVSGRKSTGLMSGGALSNWQALGRLALSRRDYALTLTNIHTRHTVGARDGVEPVFPNAYFPTSATVVDPNAARETARNDLSLRLMVPIGGGEPVSAIAFVTRQHERYSQTGLDTLETQGNRVGGRLRVPFQAGAHRLAVELAGWFDSKTWGKNNPLAGASSRTQFHGTLRDSVSFSGWNWLGEAGAHVLDDAFFPSGRVRIERGGLFLQASYAGHIDGRFILDGYAGQIGPSMASDSRTMQTTGGVSLSGGPFDLSIQGVLSTTSNPRQLLVSGNDVQVVDGMSSLQRGGGSAQLWWRRDNTRGVYAMVSGTASAVLNATDSDLHQRENDALPALWGSGRFGVKAGGIFGGNLDIDLAARGRAWSEFLGRTFVPSAALFGVPNSQSATPIPASGTVDFILETTLQQRAQLFLVYENALAGSLYDGAFTIPVHPIPRRRIRFGIFWTLDG